MMSIALTYFHNGNWLFGILWIFNTWLWLKIERNVIIKEEIYKINLQIKSLFVELKENFPGKII